MYINPCETSVNAQCFSSPVLGHSDVTKCVGPGPFISQTMLTVGILGSMENISH